MNSNSHSHVEPFAWVILFGAIIGITSYVPVLPYIAGGGVIPLSIAFAALSTLILGFVPGIMSAVIGGTIGAFISPASYPFGVLDIFFIAVAPSIMAGLAFRGSSRIFRVFYLIVVLLGASLAELVPYSIPGRDGGYAQAPQPLYGLLVSLFFVPWLIIYISPLGLQLIERWTISSGSRIRFVGLSLGMMTGLMPWALWMISPWAYVSKFTPEMSVANWALAALARVVLSLIAAGIGTPLLNALSRSGMPVPHGSLWRAR